MAEKKTGLFFLNGDYENAFLNNRLFHDESLIIGVDGGTEFLEKHIGAKYIDYIIGDFDSYREPSTGFPGAKIIRFPEKKDYTDSVGAFLYIREKFKLEEFHFFGVSGKREDHFLSLIYSFYKYREKIFFHTLFEDILFLKPGNHLFYPGKHREFSLFPLNDIENLSMEGAKYSFPSVNLSLTGQGVSNITEEECFSLGFSDGDIILFIQKKNPLSIEIENYFK